MNSNKRALDKAGGTNETGVLLSKQKKKTRFSEGKNWQYFCPFWVKFESVNNISLNRTTEWTYAKCGAVFFSVNLFYNKKMQFIIIIYKYYFLSLLL